MGETLTRIWSGITRTPARWQPIWVACLIFSFLATTSLTVAHDHDHDHEDIGEFAQECGLCLAAQTDDDDDLIAALPVGLLLANPHRLLAPNDAASLIALDRRRAHQPRAPPFS
ncbi:MAG: hypothetical protein AAFY83_08100 [Pseudomonadota bacterium]